MVGDARIIFHAGFHKTGTTSLQTALHLHASALSPLFTVQTRANNPNLLAAAEAARDHSIASAADAAQTGARLAARVVDWVDALNLPPGRGLLVSCEDFAGHMPGRFGLRDYRAALPITAVLRSVLRSRFPDHALTFLYTTRAPADWLRSIHWQLSRHDELTLGPNRFARSHAAAADFAPVLDALRTAMPGTPVVVAPLADLTTRRLGPVEAIYDAANLPDALRASLHVPPRANPSPAHDLARVFVRLNRSDLPRAEVRRLKRDMLMAEDLLLGQDNATFPDAPESRFPLPASWVKPAE